MPSIQQTFSTVISKFLIAHFHEQQMHNVITRESLLGELVWTGSATRVEKGVRVRGSEIVNYGINQSTSHLIGFAVHATLLFIRIILANLHAIHMRWKFPFEDTPPEWNWRFFISDFYFPEKFALELISSRLTLPHDYNTIIIKYY